MVVVSKLLRTNCPRSHFQSRFDAVENSYVTHARRCGYREQVLPKARYDCPGEFHVVLFAALVGAGAFDRARVNGFQSMMLSSDNLVGLPKFLAVIHLILQSRNKLTIQNASL